MNAPLENSDSQPKPNDPTAPRPSHSRRWVCGYQRSGLACSEGPTARGACCHSKPEPCIPQPAFWYSRQTLAINLAILAAGLLVLCMSLPQREAIFVPGGLSKKHAQILGNRIVAERCSLCHVHSHADIPREILQDDLCLKCHASHMPDAGLRSPHDLSATQLQAITNRLASFASSSQPADPQPTNCATCHIEHRGESFDLTAMSDSSCQACHQKRFESLTEGHPQFEGYPYGKQRGLAFDHVAHQSKHFVAKSESFDCTKCHVDREQTGELGSVFRSVGFERACASCHAESIRSTMINGWALLQLPSVDADLVSGGSLELADWPQAARFGNEGLISIPLRLLLAGDPEVSHHLARLPASGKLDEVSSEDGQRDEMTSAIAAAVRRLVADVAEQGQVAWKRRLETTGQHALGRELNSYELALIEEMSRGVPPDLFRQMERQWFNNQAVALSTKRTSAQLISQSGKKTIDLLDEDDDELLTADGLLSTDGLLSADGLLRDDAAAPGAGEADDLLRESPSGASELASERLADDLLDGGALTPSRNLAGQTARPKFTAIRGSVHVSAGGWFLDSQLYALRYMPLGHADRTLAAWAEFAALLDSDVSASVEHSLGRDFMRGEVVPGSCAQCHLLSAAKRQSEPGSVWRGRTRSHTARPFTKFDHTPHLTLPTLSDCRYCHVLDGSKEVSLQRVIEEQMSVNAYAKPSELYPAVCQVLKTEFTAMRLDQCAACHRPSSAGDGCTQCHNYHVGATGLGWSQ